MKRAHQYREYRNVNEFEPPDGIVTVEIDPLTGQLATAACPTTRPEVFISGTQPVESCRLHGGTGGTRVASWENPPAPQPVASTPAPGIAPPQPLAAGPPSHASAPPATGQAAQAKPPEKEKEKKKGFFGRLFGVFK
jgi:hypothetical protein